MIRLIKVSLFIFVFIQYGYSINPMKEYKVKPEQFEMDYKELKIKTSDGASLNTWVMNTQSENKKNYTFVIAGSDVGNMGFTLAYVAYLLNDGYDVVTFDYRGFGESSNFEFNPNNLYHDEYIEDFRTIINWVRSELKPENIGVLAFSMGTLISTAGYEDAKYEILISEGFIKCPKKVAKRIKNSKGKAIKLPKPSKSLCNKSKKINIPILVFASEKAKIATLKDSQQVVKQRQNRKLIVHNGEHLRGAFTIGLDNYLDKINEFIENLTDV